MFPSSRASGLGPPVEEEQTPPRRIDSPHSAAEREGNNFKVFEYFCRTNGSNQGQDLDVAVLFVPNSVESGGRKCQGVGRQIPQWCRRHQPAFERRAINLEE